MNEKWGADYFLINSKLILQLRAHLYYNRTRRVWKIIRFHLKSVEIIFLSLLLSHFGKNFNNNSIKQILGKNKTIVFMLKIMNNSNFVENNYKKDFCLVYDLIN